MIFKQNGTWAADLTDCIQSLCSHHQRGASEIKIHLLYWTCAADDGSRMRTSRAAAGVTSGKAVVHLPFPSLERSVANTTQSHRFASHLLLAPLLRRPSATKVAVRIRARPIGDSLRSHFCTIFPRGASFDVALHEPAPRALIGAGRLA